MRSEITIVVMTRDRIQDLRATLPRLLGLPGRPPVIVVDNGSSDGTVGEVRRTFPEVDVIALGRNDGVRARNIGVLEAVTPYVAFADDDSWWSPAAMSRLTASFDAHPRLGAITGHVVVEPGGADDPVTELMQNSPVDGAPDLPGIPVLGFLACATAVRREAFLGVGGFHERLHFAGEEQLLAVDLAAAGWAIRYLPDTLVHHQPSSQRASEWRRRRELRNTLWFLWLRRPPSVALRRSLGAVRAAEPRVALPATGSALLGLPWVLGERRVVPPGIERSLRRLDAANRLAHPTVAG